MFGVQRGEGAVQFARSGPELMCHEQGGPLTHSHCGTRFSLSRVCQYLHAKLEGLRDCGLSYFGFVLELRRVFMGLSQHIFFLCARQYAHAKLV